VWIIGEAKDENNKGLRQKHDYILSKKYLSFGLEIRFEEKIGRVQFKVT
jgi:hypothetical protein